MKQVVVISGPTGSGEGTITSELIRRYPNKFARLVTATTRPPRDQEQHGIDYYFFSKEEFSRLREEGVIPEAGYVANRDTYYGSYIPDLEAKSAQGLISIANVQIEGTKFYKKNYNATTVFIDPPSIDIVMARVRKRSPGLSEEEYAARRTDAERETREEGPFYDYHVVNEEGKLDETVDTIMEILKKEGYTLDS
ncbi:MAG: hypothetical protein WA021_03460 [Minisyncoccia bacterium]